MKYSTEMMKKIAQQLGEMIKTAVMEQIEREQDQPTIAQIEQGMRESLRQIGQESLGMVSIFRGEAMRKNGGGVGNWWMVFCGAGGKVGIEYVWFPVINFQD